jgi:RNA polymerase sigma-70 factor, ECF subfamily
VFSLLTARPAFGVFDRPDREFLAVERDMLTAELTDETEETTLVLAAQAGDREAFGQLAERYEGSVYATAFRRLGNHAEAQEVCQEVFVKALQKLDQLRQPECFGGWLRSVAARLSINRAVRRGPAISTDPENLAATVADSQTPLESVLERERHASVRAGLGRLGEMDRKTLVAFYVQGQSIVEMSDRFDSPVGTIKRRLHVARKRLARELEDLVAV